MRQLAPLSPAVHLGANRVLVDRHARQAPPPRRRRRRRRRRHRARATCSGFVLDSLFTDGLSIDLERLQPDQPADRRRRADSRAPADPRDGDPAERRPDRDRDASTSDRMPRSIRTLLRTIGALRGTRRPAGELPAVRQVGTRCELMATGLRRCAGAARGDRSPTSRPGVYRAAPACRARAARRSRSRR